MDAAARIAQLGPAAVLQSEPGNVVGVNLERLLREQVVEPFRAPGLGPGMVRGETPSGGEPDRMVLVDGFLGVAVVEHLEDATAVQEAVLVQPRGTRMTGLGHRPLVLAPGDPVPVEAGVGR